MEKITEENAKYWVDVYEIFLRKRIDKQIEINQKKKELEEIDETLDKMLVLGKEWGLLKN